MGNAIVTTDAPGCRDVVEHGVNGLLVPTGDVGALTAAVETLILDPEKRAQLGRAARQRAETEFDEQKVVAQYLAVYDRILKDRVTVQAL